MIIVTAGFRWLQRTSIVIAALMMAVATAAATEFELKAFLVPAERVAEAIGSGDSGLAERVKADSAAIETLALNRRFNPPEIWRIAVDELVDGTPRTNEFANGFAIELLLRALTADRDRGMIGAPFADLQTAMDYFAADGQDALSDLLYRINWGNTGDGSDMGLPEAVAGLIGVTEYPARVSVIRHQDALQAAAVLEDVSAAGQGINDYVNGIDSPAAERFLRGVEAAERASWGAYFDRQEPHKPEAERQAAIAGLVNRTLEDPYLYIDSVGTVAAEAATIRGWLERAHSTGKDLFLVYASY